MSPSVADEAKQIFTTRPDEWKLPASLKLSTYLSSPMSRISTQKAAKGAKADPTGREVDAYIPSTLSRKNLAKYVAESSHKATEIKMIDDDEQRVSLGLEDLNDAGLQDDHATLPSGLPKGTDTSDIPRTSITQGRSIRISPELLDKVFRATNATQTFVPYIEAPPAGVSPSILTPNDFGFVDPRAYGGTSFDLVGNGQHEPLNVIVSSLSSPDILTRRGFQSYCRSLNFDRECFGLHLGTPQKSFTDFRGWRDQELLYRQVYSPLDHIFGTCTESLLGGNHIRAWQQQASGAWFLAVSKEENASKNHMIIPDGYNIGRDELVEKALGSKKDGKTKFLLTSYCTQMTYVAGLMPSGVEGEVNHGIPVDGLTAILKVTMIGKDGGAASSLSQNSHARADEAPAEPNAVATHLKKKANAAWVRMRASIGAKQSDGSGDN